jgi:hypothetical protein
MKAAALQKASTSNTSSIGDVLTSLLLPFIKANIFPLIAEKLAEKLAKPIVELGIVEKIEDYDDILLVSITEEETKNKVKKELDDTKELLSNKNNDLKQKLKQKITDILQKPESILEILPLYTINELILLLEKTEIINIDEILSDTEAFKNLISEYLTQLEEKIPSEYKTIYTSSIKYVLSFSATLFTNFNNSLEKIIIPDRIKSIIKKLITTMIDTINTIKKRY